MRKHTAQSGTSSQDPLVTSEPSGSNRTVQDDLAEQPEVYPLRRSTRKDAGFYRDGDSTLDSDGDEEQPKKFNPEDFDRGDYIIFRTEGAVFPGQVSSIRHKSCYLTVETMLKHPNPIPSYWTWPGDKSNEVPVKNVINKINKPVLKDQFVAPFVYKVEEVAKYWTV